jgi:Transposase IS116/IS110/IS902 family
LTVPGIGWVLAFTIASEIGDITRFPSAKKLCGYTGLCPRVHQSGESDRRGPLTKQGPKYLRWAMLESTMHALRHPAYAERYQRNKKRLGRQRGARVAQIDIARKLTEAIWHMLTNGLHNRFASARGPARARFRPERTEGSAKSARRRRQIASGDVSLRRMLLAFCSAFYSAFRCALR